MEYYRLTIPIPKQPWRWIRFRISTLLLLVAMLGMTLAWQKDHERLSEQLNRLQHPVTGWDASQATGPPNTAGPGDISTAWAPATQDDQPEWLLLEYDAPVIPTAILVHETFNPGAVFQVTHCPKWGPERMLWQGADPTPASARAGVSRLPVTGNIKTGRIKLYLNSPGIPGWNEIDAVGVEYGQPKRVMWAARATASSSYGDDGKNPLFAPRILVQEN